MADPDYIDISDESDLEPFIGKAVRVRGRLTNTRCPSLNDIDVWELDGCQDERVEVTGVLQAETITEADIKAKEAELGGIYANQGPGTFYHLKNLDYRMLEDE